MEENSSTQLFKRECKCYAAEQNVIFCIKNTCVNIGSKDSVSNGYLDLPGRFHTYSVCILETGIQYVDFIINYRSHL